MHRKLPFETVDKKGRNRNWSKPLQKDEVVKNSEGKENEDVSK